MSTPKPLSKEELAELSDFMEHPECKAVLNAELFYGHKQGARLLTCIRELLSAEQYWREKAEEMASVIDRLA